MIEGRDRSELLYDIKDKAVFSYSLGKGHNSIVLQHQA